MADDDIRYPRLMRGLAIIGVLAFLALIVVITLMSREGIMLEGM